MKIHTYQKSIFLFRRMHNLDKEVAASGFTKEMEKDLQEVRNVRERGYRWPLYHRSCRLKNVLNLSACCLSFILPCFPPSPQRCASDGVLVRVYKIQHELVGFFLDIFTLTICCVVSNLFNQFTKDFHFYAMLVEKTHTFQHFYLPVFTQNIPLRITF